MFGSSTKDIPEWKKKSELLKSRDNRIKKFGEGKSSDMHRWLKEFSKLMFRMAIPREVGTELISFFLTGTALTKYNNLDTNDTKEDTEEEKRRRRRKLEKKEIR